MDGSRYRSGRTRRLWLSGAVTSVLALVALLFVNAAGATLSGSSFDTTNGSLTDTSLHDWNPPGSPAGNVGPLQAITCPATAPGAGTNCGLDLTGSSSDDSFSMGPKEDDAAPAVGTGSIPPNKDDLSRFYVNQEKAGGNDYLYLAWERTNTLGSAHLDFEFNQSNTASANGVTKLRTAGDMLVTFDFGGSGVPTLSLSRWVTSGAASQCEVPADGVPCWGALVNLTTGGFADGSVNSADVLDNNPPGNPRTLSGSTSKNGSISSTFGEAGINLTGAGVFSQNVCQHFGAADLKSRSSGQSFTSTLKDFIAPIPVNISNCGEIKIIKHTDPRGVNQNFSFTSNIPDPVGASTTPSCTSDTTPSAFTLNDSAGVDNSTNTEDCVNVPAGSYNVTEGGPPANFALESLTCTATGGSSGAQDSVNPAKANITLVPDSVVTCVYVNKQQLGAIKITKTSSKGQHPGLDGAVFTISSGGAPIAGSPFTTSGGGVICVDHLPFGTYSVQETAAPTGYSIDDSTAHNVVVNANATCGSGTEATFAATDTPLSQITVTFHSKAGVGVTTATIQCTGTPALPGGNDTTTQPLPDNTTGRLLDNLVPGTYSCTVVIDP